MRSALPLSLALFAFACAPESTAPAPTRAALEGDNVLEDDTTTAVMFYNTGGNKCAATVVQTDPSAGTGAAITDAHCVTIGRRSEGLLFQSAAAQVEDADTNYPTTGSDRIYERNVSDLMLLLFSGATVDTPVMQMVDPCEDVVRPGSTLRLVSYGEPLVGEGALMSPVRQSVEVTVSEVGPLQIFVDGASGAATCNRDQGGAALLDGRLVGVITGPAECDGDIVINRISPFVNSWVLPSLMSPPGPMRIPCPQCVALAIHPDSSATCRDERVTCQGDAACRDAISCAERCSTESCVMGCRANANFNALLTCAIGFCQSQLCSATSCGPGGMPDGGTPGEDGGTAESDAGPAGTTDGGTTSGGDAGSSGGGGGGGGDGDGDGDCAAGGAPVGLGVSLSLAVALITRRRRSWRLHSS